MEDDKVAVFYFNHLLLCFSNAAYKEKYSLIRITIRCLLLNRLAKNRDFSVSTFLWAGIIFSSTLNLTSDSFSFMNSALRRCSSDDFGTSKPRPLMKVKSKNEKFQLFTFQIVFRQIKFSCLRCSNNPKWIFVHSDLADEMIRSWWLDVENLPWVCVYNHEK